MATSVLLPASKAVGGGGLEAEEIAKTVHTARSVAGRAAEQAFSALVNRFERTALAVAYACCGDSALAGDVTQEAFLRAWQRLDELEDETKFGAWLCGIVRNLAIDAKRRGPKRTESIEDGSAVAMVQPADPLQRVEEEDRIAKALRQLDDQSRAVVVLRYYENLGSAAIAELLGSTPTAVDMRLSRARRTLRELLDENEAVSRP